MPPVVDEIIVDIAIDARKINDGIKELNQRTERLEKSSDEAADELKRINDTPLDKLRQGLDRSPG